MSKRRSSGLLTEREGIWLAHLERVQSQGVTIKAYAQEQGVSFHAMYQAKKRLRALGAWPARKKTAPASFARVAVRDEATTRGVGACRLRVGGDAMIEWEVAPSAELLAAVIKRVAGRG
jgi:hypothetical protein